MKNLEKTMNQIKFLNRANLDNNRLEDWCTKLEKALASNSQTEINACLKEYETFEDYAEMDQEVFYKTIDLIAKHTAQSILEELNAMNTLSIAS